MFIGAVSIKKIKRPALAALALLSVAALSFGLSGKKEEISPEENVALVFSVEEHFEEGHFAPEPVETEPDTQENIFLPTLSNVMEISTFGDLQKYLYTIDKYAYVTPEDLNLKKLLEMDFKTELQGEEPKVLIFHTHSQEAFIDSRKGETDDTIVGVGKLLAEILVEQYQIPVVHDVGKYDFKDGKENRESSYGNMEPAVTKLLEKYPGVEIAIDLHRDALPDNSKLVTEINGKPTAKIMFFNGITRINDGGRARDLPELINPFLEENLALSLQMKLKANEMYPDFSRKIYIKPYRYSLHMLEKSMLIEVGSNTNTVEEAKNAMYPLAEIIVEVLGQ